MNNMALGIRRVRPNGIIIPGSNRILAFRQNKFKNRRTLRRNEKLPPLTNKDCSRCGYETCNKERYPAKNSTCISQATG